MSSVVRCSGFNLFLNRIGCGLDDLKRLVRQNEEIQVDFDQLRSIICGKKSQWLRPLAFHGRLHSVLRSSAIKHADPLSTGSRKKYCALLSTSVREYHPTTSRSLESIDADVSDGHTSTLCTSAAFFFDQLLLPFGSSHRIFPSLHCVCSFGRLSDGEREAPKV